MQLLIQIVVPAFLVTNLWRTRGVSRRTWGLKVLAHGAMLGFFVIAARWDWFSYYLRVAWPVLFCVAAIRSYPRGGGVALESGSARGDVWTSLILFSVMTFFGGRALRGYWCSGEAVQLEFPLRNGCYYVGGGGANRFINGHFAYPGQSYALDIVRLNGLGRGSGFSAGHLDGYPIFSDPVFSPCHGTVTRAVDGLPDLIPPATDPVNLAGNHVILLRPDGLKVLLAHLKNGSVAVTNGQTVAPGQLLGRIGNSGNTSQPHLHIHVERGGTADSILDGEAVPMTFRGRFLVRNSLVFDFSGRKTGE
jgi:hypothetical protein